LLPEHIGHLTDLSHGFSNFPPQKVPVLSPVSFLVAVERLPPASGAEVIVGFLRVRVDCPFPFPASHCGTCPPGSLFLEKGPILRSMPSPYVDKKDLPLYVNQYFFPRRPCSIPLLSQTHSPGLKSAAKFVINPSDRLLERSSTRRKKNWDGFGNSCVVLVEVPAGARCSRTNPASSTYTFPRKLFA